MLSLQSLVPRSSFETQQSGNTATYDRHEKCAGARVRRRVKMSTFYEATFGSYRVLRLHDYVYDYERPTPCNVRYRNELIRLGFMGDTDNITRGTVRPWPRRSTVRPTLEAVKWWIINVIICFSCIDGEKNRHSQKTWSQADRWRERSKFLLSYNLRKIRILTNLDQNLMNNKANVKSI